MSAYIVNNETISVIAKGFVDYNLEFEALNYRPNVQVIFDFKGKCEDIGQVLLNQNYKSVNYRYREQNEPPKFEYKDIKSDEGTLFGCIECYIYQACETDYFFESELYKSLLKLKLKMLEKMIQEKGQKIPWGYEPEDEY